MYCLPPTAIFHKEQLLPIFWASLILYLLSPDLGSISNNNIYNLVFRCPTLIYPYVEAVHSI